MALLMQVLSGVSDTTVKGFYFRYWPVVDIRENAFNVAFGAKRTCHFALHMSANDPKRTWPNSIFKKFIARGMPVDCRSITLIDWSSSTLNYWLRRTNKKKHRPKPMGIIGGGYNANTRARGPFKTLIGFRKDRREAIFLFPDSSSRKWLYRTLLSFADCY